MAFNPTYVCLTTLKIKQSQLQHMTKADQTAQWGKIEVKSQCSLTKSFQCNAANLWDVRQTPNKSKAKSPCWPNKKRGKSIDKNNMLLALGFVSVTIEKILLQHL